VWNSKCFWTPSAVVLAEVSAVIASVLENSCVFEHPSAVVLAKVSAVIAASALVVHFLLCIHY
jgi:hypothetical protein